MKKLMFGLMLGSIMLCVASSLFAEGMTFGVKGGLNMAKVTGDDVEEADWKMGGVGGVFLTYAISEIFSVQPELLFSMKGSKETFADTTYSYKVNYIEIPLLAKVYLPTEGKIKPHLFAGPAIGILLSAKATSDPGDEEIDFKDETKSTDFGFLAGAGVEYKMESGSVLFDVRYEVGLTTIDKGDGEAADIKNSAISFMAGYGFAF